MCVRKYGIPFDVLSLCCSYCFVLFFVPHGINKWILMKCSVAVAAVYPSLYKTGIQYQSIQFNPIHRVTLPSIYSLQVHVHLHNPSISPLSLCGPHAGRLLHVHDKTRHALYQVADKRTTNGCFSCCLCAREYLSMLLQPCTSSTAKFLRAPCVTVHAVTKYAASINIKSS